MAPLTERGWEGAVTPQGVKIDWSLTLELLGVIAGGALVAVGARRLLLEQRASVSSVEVTEDELWVLRRIETDGPLLWGFKTPSGTGGWMLQGREKFLKPESESKTNAHFSALVRELRRRDLLDKRAQVLTLNDASRAVLRRDAGREVSGDRIRLEFFRR